MWFVGLSFLWAAQQHSISHGHQGSASVQLPLSLAKRGNGKQQNISMSACVIGLFQWRPYERRPLDFGPIAGFKRANPQKLEPVWELHPSDMPLVRLPDS